VSPDLSKGLPYPVASCHSPRPGPSRFGDSLSPLSPSSKPSRPSSRARICETVATVRNTRALTAIGAEKARRHEPYRWKCHWRVRERNGGTDSVESNVLTVCLLCADVLFREGQADNGTDASHADHWQGVRARARMRAGHRGARPVAFDRIRASPLVKHAVACDLHGRGAALLCAQTVSR
jgi:hypothetical protein